MATSAKRKKAKSNIGLKASRLRPLRWISFLRSRRKINRKTLAMLVALTVAIGGFIVYKSLAASFNGNDEVEQVTYINTTRANLFAGRHPVSTKICIRDVARLWSYHMAQSGTFEHNPNNTSQIANNCGISGISWSAENIAAQSGGCTETSSDPCSANLYKGLVGSPGHYSNIIECKAEYVGVGVYVRDGKEWITQNFISTRQYSLCGSSRVAVPGGTKVRGLKAAKGQTVTFYHAILNSGPSTANYQQHVKGYHYSGNWTLLFTNQSNTGSRTTTAEQRYNYNHNLTIPFNASSGHHYCQVIFYSNATGPGTPVGNSARACATVK